MADRLQSSTAQVVVVFATEGQLLELLLEVRTLHLSSCICLGIKHGSMQFVRRISVLVVFACHLVIIKFMFIYFPVGSQKRDRDPVGS